MTRDQQILKMHYDRDVMPKEVTQYLMTIQDERPAVIFDIGSCVLHWVREARKVWPQADYHCFDVYDSNVIGFLYDVPYHQGVLSDCVKEVDFFLSIRQPGGCSYYQENPEFSAGAKFFNQASRMITTTLDLQMEHLNLPQPDLIKMDTQGSELDIIKGGLNTILKTKHVILELQEVDYNVGAPKAQTVIDYMSSIGFDCIAEKFSKNVADADYHFVNQNI